MESTVLVKAFALLEILSGKETDGTLAALSLAARQSKPTVHRILQNLVALGYVEPLAGGKYRLTDKLRQLDFSRSDRLLMTVARPVLEGLRQRTGETVNLGVLRNHRIVYLTTLESAHALRRVADAGGENSDPLFTTALGRVIVANLPPPQRERLLRVVPTESRTPHTVTHPDELRTVLAQAVGDGYAIEHDQTDVGVTCCAAAVLVGGSVVAAISVSAPTARAAGRERLWADWVRAAAAQVGREMTDRERASA